MVSLLSLGLHKGLLGDVGAHTITHRPSLTLKVLRMALDEEEAVQVVRGSLKFRCCNGMLFSIGYKLN